MRMALPILIFVYKVVIMKVKTNAEITEFLSKIGEPMGITVVETEFKQGKNPNLTVYIDKEGGIDLDTCEAFHRAIDQPIDELDPTFGLPYTLNVSSLGIDRPFKTDKDFIDHIGKRVEVKLNQSIRGKKFYDGVLNSYDGKVITLKVDQKTTFTIELKNTQKVNEYIEW
ncbi:MAG: ribosome maturation factor RimP [Clostridiales bacterium]|nr:ribosome maturation factor RimP [Clostridiales bacterium]